MAQMRDTGSGSLHPLRAHHTFGRQDQVDSKLELGSVSRIHAVIEWNGDAWMLRDLSRNGTWLDGAKLEPNQPYSISAGQLISFGSPRQTPWVVADIAPPQDMLIDTRSGASKSLGRFHFFPNEEQPEQAFYYRVEDGLWYLDEIASGECCSIGHGDSFSCGESIWRLFLVGSYAATEQVNLTPPLFADYQFCFSTSLDEEHSQLTLRRGSETVNLGERIHHYMLLHLARCRAEDAAAGLAEADQGWVETSQLSKDLGVEDSHINIQIFRARKQLSDSLPSLIGADQLIERRRGLLRFGGQQFQVQRGDAITHSMSAD
ncbi:MAG: FHA domain-containing protein [Cellvibrionaceae bacterium]|nr:FHA domain-containing protein [Cellvibrionaceae bacterium]